ncbi:MAG: Lrp/AsnC family transcriptional regulator [Bifidobacteriaceae bacterium]|nr:Lrp/AsnC family transcriptional regulator [Bifidobacteriaceae bacterium]
MDSAESEGSRQKIQLDALDEAIAWELVRDADQSNKALAARLGVSESTTINRVRALRRAGILGAAHSQVDLEAFGFGVQALVFIRLRPQARPKIREFAEAVARLPQTAHVFFVGGNEDFVVHVFCTSTSQLRDLVANRLSMDPAVAMTSTHVVFEHIPGNTRMDHINGWDEVRRPITEGAALCDPAA